MRAGDSCARAGAGDVAVVMDDVRRPSQRSRCRGPCGRITKEWPPQATVARLQRRLARAASRLITQGPRAAARDSLASVTPALSPGPRPGFARLARASAGLRIHSALAQEATCLRLHWSRPGVGLRATRPKATGVARLPSHSLLPRPGLRDLSLRVTRLQAAGPLCRQAPGQESGPLPGFTRLSPQRVGREGVPGRAPMDNGALSAHHGRQSRCGAWSVRRRNC